MSAPPHRKLILLGSTGSIGVNTLRVVENLDGQYEVVGMAAGRNVDLLIEQAGKFNVQRLAISDEAGAAKVKAAIPGATIFAGPDAAQQLVATTDAHMLAAAIVGAAGLPATLTAIERGMDIALANKETLVAAGELVMPLVKKHGVHLLPVDSEHSAIFQCMQTADASQNGKAIKRIVLTASGGPFRRASLETIRHATVDEALKHPTWRMGPKITIDSATMMNKALEIIEAHWLFNLGSDRIEVIIHPQSIAHSFVEFADHSVLAQLGSPDMKTPIQYALTWPQRTGGCSEPMDWTALSKLDFEQPDHVRFPALKLAYKVVDRGGTSGAILNAANEEAVAAFLDGKIEFGRIVDLNAEALETVQSEPATDLKTILSADRAARAFVRRRIGR
ncbi:MAG: 1-deoxy-D-xylulose-5-phosphate reductoisomerase [Planctomycetes bacterium]|nr:1-deoxy-D-xylulose-5-phosphate reductoisomerase [Planctomycetota bacterium]